MKVVYLYDNFPSYRKDFFELLNRSLRAKGYDFKFVYGCKRVVDSLQDSSLSFPQQGMSTKENRIGSVKFIRYKGFKKILKQESPDIIVLQFHVAVLSYWWALLYMKLHRIPYLIWDCNYTRDTLGRSAVGIRRFLVDFSYRHASSFITYGSVFKHYLLNMGIHDSDIFIAQNTINIEDIILRRSQSCSNRDFDHPVRILYVGALLDRKYVDAAIMAISHLVSEGYDIYFDVVGSGAEYNKLFEIIKQEKMDDRIFLYGAKHGDEVRNFFENDDVFLLPGTGGLAINEAMAYSMPIISTVGDDTIVDLLDGNGFLLKEFGNITEIEMALKNFIELSIEEKKRMSYRSEEIIKKRASLQNMVNQHINAIQYVKEKYLNIKVE